MAVKPSSHAASGPGRARGGGGGWEAGGLSDCRGSAKAVAVVHELRAGEREVSQKVSAVGRERQDLRVLPLVLLKATRLSWGGGEMFAAESLLGLNPLLSPRWLREEHVTVQREQRHRWGNSHF